MRNDHESFKPRNYWEQRLRRNFDLCGVGYAALGRPFNRWLYRLRRQTFLRRMRAIRSDFNGMRILDVGCGTGFYLDRWAEMGARDIAGVDITRIAVEDAQRRYPHGRFEVLDIGGGQSPWHEEIDAVSAMDVLFHIVDDRAFEQALHNIHRALKPGGLFIWSDNFIHRGTIRGMHQVCRNIVDIERLLDRTGFDILSRRPMFWLMNFPIDTESRFLRLWWRLLSRGLETQPWLGGLAGAALYPLERALVSLCGESPTTEMMVCRTRAPKAG